MHILLANPRGFCAGVNMAIKTLEAAIIRFGLPLYVYHEIVHNRWVVDDFRSRGVKFVSTIDEVPDGSRLMFSAHGVAPEIRVKASQKNIETIDATCPLVARVHREVLRYAADKYKIILIGHNGHDEVIGTMNEAPESIILVEHESDVCNLCLNESEKLVVLTQTTLSVTETQLMIELLRKKFPQIISETNANICYATQHRQEAITILAPLVDIVLIVGSGNSSNSKRLAERGKALGVRSILIDGADNIDVGWFHGGEKVLISAGASAPEYVVRDCVKMLQNNFNATVEERQTNTDSLSFRIPIDT
ncbi:MAG: 4-hydroxy-3-methylbut-2-enyl diphosphate reductase [Planctomycetaceae bacterium]|jgi:4-hydroxy-3-methylbut-2-enyl diphosphate reductase|nr:4-hydroxy-3-methylbut-2-enyl diphosphate reductase [Planctomycetaceae bacterium]